MTKHVLVSATLAVATATVLVSGSFLYFKLSSKATNLTNSVDALIQHNIKDDKAIKKQTALIELASNNRMASVVAYHIKEGVTLEELTNTNYLVELSETLKTDFILDNVYGRLAAFNTNIEYTPYSSTERLIRSQWKARIETGSHFDLHPQARLILSSESIDIPACKDEYQPYVAYVVATPIDSSLPAPTVEIKEESGLNPQYRFILKQNGIPVPFDTKHRILVDVGCTPTVSKDNTKEMTN